ncbi:energy-coupling factor ABC transporter ATP-binding protein [Caproiciproducens faecalis]|uniref:Energy-coupling factor ABC transporter ATP-binding protein n=1 Tax=Caproiciproducens faecalis TaxID=2820301 RepID=A0ABS7DJ21_9FIRM|nr:energy-coupling factor ABC transporter ATP-binding protein [Caproiciproducens faecalis]MBW7571290.1 energy-coupling factor ABC transporter ATP-binding protein [Caproiciproducens faecalis]
MKEKILEVDHLSFAYDNNHNALKDICLAIYKQEKIAVLGANGAGKTTFFLNLNGVREPSGGEIRYRGETVGRKNINQLRRNVGIVFQDADSQIIASTVKAEVAFGPLNMKLPRTEVEERTLSAIREMKLEDCVMRPPHYLSGGEKKRVSIADILAMNCEVMVFDEPTASLDPVNAEILEEVLDKMEQQGKTVLLSTHDVDFAYRFAQRVLVFCGGELIGDGSVEDIFRNEALLRKANLKKPVLMQLYDLLYAKGKISEVKECPKRISDFASLL